MLTMVLDASTSSSTVILATGETTIAKCALHGKALTHLHLCIRNVLDQTQVRISDIARIGVIVGPGAWTGLNVAISTAKTLAQVYDRPLIPLSFLDALALSCLHQQDFLVAIANAPAEAIFSRSFKCIDQKILPVTDHRKQSVSALAAELKSIQLPITLVGVLSTELVCEIEASGLNDVTFEHLTYPTDTALISMVNAASCDENSIQDRLQLEPLYLLQDDEAPTLYRGKP